MLDIGWSELLLVAIVAIVVVGPKDLPKLMRTFGFYAGKVRRAAADFQRQFSQAMAESEAEEVRKNIEAIRSNMGTAADFKQLIDQPLMTPTAEPPATALGAPPTGAPEAEPPPELGRRQAKATTTKTAPKKAAKKEAAPKKAAPKRAKPKKTPTGKVPVKGPSAKRGRSAASTRTSTRQTAAKARSTGSKTPAEPKS